MKVSAISQISADEGQRRNMFIRFSNSFMSSPEVANPFDAAQEANKRPAKMGIENLEEFTIFPKEVKDGKTIITA